MTDQTSTEHHLAIALLQSLAQADSDDCLPLAATVTCAPPETPFPYCGERRRRAVAGPTC